MTRVGPLSEDWHSLLSSSAESVQHGVAGLVGDYVQGPTGKHSAMLGTGARHEVSEPKRLVRTVVERVGFVRQTVGEDLDISKFINKTKLGY